MQVHEDPDLGRPRHFWHVAEQHPWHVAEQPRHRVIAGPADTVETQLRS
jgi:hypothetical protein